MSSVFVRLSAGVPAVALILAGAAGCASSTEPRGNNGGGGGGGPTFSVVAHAPRPTRLTIRNGALFWLDTSGAPIKKLVLANGTTTPVLVAAPIPESVASDGSNIYWMANGNLYKSSKDGLQSTVLDRGQRDPVSRETATIAFDGNDVYWVNAVAGGPCSPSCTFTIRKVSKSGGPATVVITTSGAILGVAVRGGFLFWEEEQDGPASADGSVGSKVSRVSLADGSVTVLVNGLLNGLIPPPSDTFNPVSWFPTGGIVVDDSAVYFGVGDQWQPYRLLRVPVGGGAFTVLVVDSSLDPSTFVRSMVADDSRMYWLDASSVNAVPKAGGASTMLTANRVAPVSIVRSGSALYWLEAQCCAHAARGSILKMSSGGGAPVMVASSIDAPVDIAVDETNLFWVSGGPIGHVESFGGIVKSALDGSAVDTLQEAAKAGPYAVDDRNLYLADGFTIKRVSLDGGLAHRLASADFYIRDIATDGVNVYWVEDPFSTVRMVSVNGGPITTLGSGEGPASVIRIDATYVYWLDHFDAIKRIPKGGGTVETVIGPIAGGITDFAVTGESIVISEWDQGGIARAPVSGGTLTTFATLNPDQNRRVAVDATTIYWSDQLEIGSVPVGGGASSAIVLGGLSSDPFVPNDIAVDASGLYWAEVGASLINKATLK